MAARATLSYVLDPMCSWCWAFRPHWKRVLGALPADVDVRYVMGGLAPDSDNPMPQAMQEHLKSTWRQVAERTGAQFNFDFWIRCRPRRSTYPACRAVLAAGLQNEQAVAEMIDAIQRAYYAEARNPSDVETLVALAEEIGLEGERFSADLDSDAVAERLRADFWTRDRFGVQGFPSVIVQLDAQAAYAVAWGYAEADAVIERLNAVLNGAATPRRGAP